MSFVEKFIEHMHRRGSEPLEKIIPDGRIHRCKIDGDKAAQRSLAYKLTIEDDSAFGWYQNHRGGEIEKFSARNKEAPTLTAEETERRKLERDERNKRYAEETERHYKKQAELSNSIWNEAKSDGIHPYLKSKNIGLEGARISGQKLIIPILDGKKIVARQEIMPDGSKKIHGRKKGNMFVLVDNIDTRRRVVICEGFATGKTLRAATTAPVVIAFDAYNIKEVAIKIRKAYPEAEIIFAADNDQWREGGNIGIEAAQTALSAVGGPGRVVFPTFPYEHPDRPTDWNDYAAEHGIDAVTKAIAIQKQEVAEYNDELRNFEPVYEEKKDWRMETLWKSEVHGIPSKSLNNLVVALRYRPGFSNVFAFNEFSHELIVLNRPEWEDGEFTPHRVQDDDITALLVAMERAGYTPTIDLINRAVDVAARKNPVNPAKEYFNSLKWDGRNRLDNWLNYYCGVEREDSGYVSAVGAKWLCSAVARVFDPGCQVDQMLILEGRQGAFKSSTLRELSTFNGEAYFSDAITIDMIDDKDTIGKLQGRLIIEFAELSGLNKKDMKSIKRWITMRQDEGRLAYERHNKIFRRQFVLAATENPVDGWLDDPTGGRRFWPVTVGKIDMNAIRSDKNQIWAEAVMRYKSGETLYLNEEQEVIADQVRSTRQVSDLWENDIAREFEARDKFTTQEICKFLSIEKQKQDKFISSRIGKIVKRMGYSNHSVYYMGRTQSCWVKDN